MRQNFDIIEIDNYRFAMEFDTGGDPCDLFPYTLWVYKDGKPFLHNDNRTQVRKEFKKNFSKAHVRNFCLKFVNNTVYRDSIVNKL